MVKKLLLFFFLLLFAVSILPSKFFIVEAVTCTVGNVTLNCADGSGCGYSSTRGYYCYGGSGTATTTTAPTQATTIPFIPGTDKLPTGWTWTQNTTPCAAGEYYCYQDATGKYQHGVPPTDPAIITATNTPTQQPIEVTPKLTFTNGTPAVTCQTVVAGNTTSCEFTLPSGISMPSGFKLAIGVGTAIGGTCNQVAITKSTNKVQCTGVYTPTLAKITPTIIDGVQGQKLPIYYIYTGVRSSQNTGSTTTVNTGVTTATFTPSPSPTKTPLTCDPVKDGVIDSKDFDLWKDEYTKTKTSTNTACFSPNNQVDLLGFQIWKDIAVYKIKQPF